MKKLFLFLFLTFLLIGIVSALYAFPESAYNLSAQSCNKENSASSHSYSSACAGVYPGACGAAGDLLSCNDGFTENSTYGPGVFGGVNITSYNSSITNCVSVTQVFLCYEWWVDRARSINDCSIQVDANGGASFSNVTTTRPAASANPGVTCANVTSLETWSCGNFFGSTGTRALAREEVTKRGTSTQTLYTDVLFFNVTYTPNTAPYNISLNLPANNTQMNNTQSSNFNFTAMDAENSILNCSIYLDGILNQSNLTTLNRTLTNFLINGISYESHNWEVNCSDGSLTNVSEVRYFVIADTVKPVINIILPREGDTYGYNDSINLSYSVFDEHLDSCWYNLDLGENISLGNNGNCQNISFGVSGNGRYAIYLYANDSLGNIAEKNINFSVNMGFPTISLKSPVNAYLNYHNAVFIYTPLDIDLESCELWGNFDGTFKKNQTDVFPLNGSRNSFNLTLPDGNYTWNIKCNDTSGHSAFNGNRRFYIDTISPGIVLLQPSGKKTSRTGIPLIFSVFDNSSVTCWYNLSYDTGGGTFVTYPGKEYVLLPNCSSTIFSVTNDYTYIIYLTVNDSAGNSNSASSSFGVLTISPPQQNPGGSGSCLYNWNCTEWGKCSQEGKQTRTCRNISLCSKGYNAPKTEQNCTYFASEKTLLASEKALFDIVLTVINPQIILGENLTARISLVNYGNKTNLNVTLNYTITDSNNKTILREKEIVPVEIQNEFIKEFVLPSQITLGEYKLFVEINYGGQEKEAVSQGSFKILPKKQGFFPFLIGKAIWTDSDKRNYLITGTSLLVIIIIVVYVLIKKSRRENKQYEKINRV